MKIQILLATCLLGLTSICMAQTTNTFPPSGNVGIGTTNPTDKFQIEGNQFSIRNSTTNNGIIFNVNAFGHPAIIPTNGVGTMDKSLLLAPYGGNVGIGTSTPSEKLSVNGNIRAREIKVEAANWPDYVFEDSYKIKTLEELESYIKINKRLPNMPSAKEVENNGVEMGDLLKKLLKNQEELTLHLIAQEKTIKTLEKKILAQHSLKTKSKRK